MSPDDRELDLSIIVPAFNERHRIENTLDEIAQTCQRLALSFEILVIDDGSTDSTSACVEEKKKCIAEIKLIRLPENRGKGYAVRSGVLASRGTLVGFADADGSTPFDQITALIAALKSAEVAIGSRALSSITTKVETSLHRKVLGRVFNAVVNIVLVPGISDTQCGFKLFSKRAAHFLFSRQTAERFSFDVEILFLAQRCKIKIIEVPVNWHNVEGSKVNLLSDALRMLVDTIRFRFIHAHVSNSTYLSAEHSYS